MIVTHFVENFEFQKEKNIDTKMVQKDSDMLCTM